MVIMRLAAGLALALFVFNASSVWAAGRDGDLTLCSRPFGSIGPSQGGVLAISSRCETLDPAIIEEPNEKLVAFIKQMDTELWRSRLKRVLYLYTLTVGFTGSEAIELNLSSWEVTHSPYTWMAESFAYKIPPCSRLVLKFYSPWAPEAQTASVNVGIRGNGGVWTTIGSGQTSILIPRSRFEYLAEMFAIEPLPPGLTMFEEQMICRAAR